MIDHGEAVIDLQVLHEVEDLYEIMDEQHREQIDEIDDFLVEDDEHDNNYNHHILYINLVIDEIELVV